MNITQQMVDNKKSIKNIEKNSEGIKKNSEGIKKNSEDIKKNSEGYKIYIDGCPENLKVYTSIGSMYLCYN